MADPTVAAGLARGLMDLAVSKGADRQQLIERSGIDPADLRDPDNRVPLPKYVALMRAGKALSNDPALALHYGETVDLSEFSIVGLLFHACETIADGMAQVNRYGQLVIEVDVGTADRAQFARRDGKLWMFDARRNPDDFPELTESTFARFISMTRPLAQSAGVEEVHVSHAPPAHRAEYDRIFQAPTMFESDWNAMRIDEAWLTRRLRRQPRYAFGIFSEHARALLKNLETSVSARGRVESVVLPILHTGSVSMDLVAGKLGCSRQTLYRRLKAENVTFEALLDDLRRALARDYLRSRKASVKEVAYLLGFSHPAAFSRAFKRWTGSSPRAIQASATSDA